MLAHRRTRAQNLTLKYRVVQTYFAFCADWHRTLKIKLHEVLEYHTDANGILGPQKLFQKFFGKRQSVKILHLKNKGLYGK